MTGPGWLRATQVMEATTPGNGGCPLCCRPIRPRQEIGLVGFPTAGPLWTHIRCLLDTRRALSEATP